MKKMFKGVVLEVVEGDITCQSDVDAIANAANAQLQTGGGVAGAVHRAAGPGLAQECRPLAPLNPGDAVITGAHNLPNEYVVHCLGPVYAVDTPSDRLLARCYQEALRRAEEHGVRSIAFPSISTGVFGYPMAEAAQVAFGAILDALPLASVRYVRFVLFGQQAFEIHLDALEELPGDFDAGV